MCRTSHTTKLGPIFLEISSAVATSRNRHVLESNKKGKMFIRCVAGSVVEPGAVDLCGKFQSRATAGRSRKVREKLAFSKMNVNPGSQNKKYAH